MSDGNCRTQMGGFKLRRSRYDLAGNSRGGGPALNRAQEGSSGGTQAGATQEGGRRPGACSDHRAEMQAPGRQNLGVVRDPGPPHFGEPLRRGQSILKTTWPCGKGVCHRNGNEAGQGEE